MSERTAKSEVLRVLREAGVPMAVHEISARVVGYSENALATRISELHTDDCEIVGRTRPGEQFKEWRLATPEEKHRLEDARRARPAAAGRPKGPAAQVIAVQPYLGDPQAFETVILKVPAGALKPGQEVRFA